MNNTKDTSKIPYGEYCYSIIGGPDEQGRLKTKPCPYLTNKVFNGVEVPWCNFLECGGLNNSHDDSEVSKLVDYFGGESKMNEELPLMLLWDQVKECGMNHSEELTP
jgi:hypothetical protein